MLVNGYSPFGGQGGAKAMLGDPAIVAIAAAHGVGSAQVVLRWNIQHGVAVNPLTDNPQYMRQNLDLWGFELSDAQMRTLDTWQPAAARAVHEARPTPPPSPPPRRAPAGFVALLLGTSDARGKVLRPPNFNLTRAGAGWGRGHSAGFFEFQASYADLGSYTLRTNYAGGRCATTSNCDARAVGQSAGCQGLDQSGVHAPVYTPTTLALRPNVRYIVSAVIRTNFSRATNELFLRVFMQDRAGRALNNTRAGGGLPSATRTRGSGSGAESVDGWARLEWEWVSPP